MRDGTHLVVIEVRSRSRTGFATPAETIDARKQGKIIRATEHLLAANPQLDCPVRIDVISVTGPGLEHIEWMRNAFTAD